MSFVPEQPEREGPPSTTSADGPGTPGTPGIPWNVDTSPAATRRRGLKFFHAVAILMGGGLGLAHPGPWLLVAATVWLATVAWSARRHLPANTAAVTQLGTQITELYAAVNRGNAEIERARQAAVAASPPPPDPDPRSPA